MKIHLETLNIRVDQQDLAGSLLAPAAAVPGVLFVHGWGGSQEQDLERARAAAGLGCVCLTFDLRGHRRTEQQREMVSRETNLRDLVAAYDLFASQRTVEESAVAVVGSSYGAYLGAVLSSLRPVRWLAMRAPALYKDEHWDWPKRRLHDDPDLPAYRNRSIKCQDNRALRACAEFRGDVLIVESEHDELIPHAVVVNYVSALTRARSLTCRTITGADHALTRAVDQSAYTNLLTNWLTEMVVGARGDAVPPEVPGASAEKGAADSIAARRRV